ncbi:hypothetical protein BDD12DRAFT_824407 [Trichophaea hybrida]|nr:hypothetical protein BDD12DRAFT_824407 [Trichophaea hybrida]
MLFNPSRLFTYAALFCFFSQTLAVPYLGITHDFGQGPTAGVQSYSGVIEFSDTTASTMSDGQFVNLIKVAYNEMVAKYRSEHPQGDNQLPGAMIGLASGKKIYFASSIKVIQAVEFYARDSKIREYFDFCLIFSLGSHRTGGACGEPNVLDLWYGENDADPPSGSTVSHQPRIAAWLRFPGDAVGTERNYKPCSSRNGSGYGCKELVKDKGLVPVFDVQPVTTGQDNWNFVRRSLRQACNH